MRVALVNTNRIQPPIAPIGLDYVGEALLAAGHAVELLDLCWAAEVEPAVDAFFGRGGFALVGVTLRNTDDCGYPTHHSFLPELAAVVRAIRARTDAPIVLGGVGFSVMPEPLLEMTRADFGVWSGGEFALAELATRIERREDWRGVANLIWPDQGCWRRNPPSTRPLSELPPMSRTLADNRRYFREGGQAGFETKRGCPGECVYCADPLAKGSRVNARPAAAVAGEIERLLAQGIDHLHTCDGEFNLPAWHALEVCREIRRRGLGDKLRWYAYCAPAPFSPELAAAMRAAGCAGINFGTDNGDDGMLRRLRRGFTSDDIRNAVRWSKEAGMAVMLDLLLGSPGESRESLACTIELMKQVEADRVGVTVGVRVYGGTELSRFLYPPPDPLEPHCFLEPAVAPFAFEYLDSLIGDDPRFLFFDPTKPGRNYNYNANQRLVEAIRQGHRGAYWDILRRCG